MFLQVVESISFPQVQVQSALLQSALLTKILPGPPHPIDIGILYQLETLHFLVNFHTTSYPVFAELLALLAQVSSNTIFRELVIECQFLKAVELVACASDWLALDTTLMRPEFDGLTAVVFTTRTRPVASMKASASAILLEQLPGVRAKGVKLSLYTDLL
jgi:hypothetical protein